jgi:hypothetical protein
MKWFVRNKLTQAYLTADGGWTHDFELAHIFRNMEMALRAGGRHQNMELEMVLVRGASPSVRYDITLPLLGASDLQAP